MDFGPTVYLREQKMMNFMNLKQSSPTNILDQKYILDRMNTLARAVTSLGIPVTVDSKRAWDYFYSLTPENQRDIIRRFDRYMDVIADITGQGIGLMDNAQALWRICKRFDWMPYSEIIERVNRQDVIEIYLADNTQLYRNMSYFKYSSYSISDLVFCPWHDLIEHGEKVTTDILNIINQTFVGQADPKKTFTLDPWVARERYSTRKYEARLTSKFFAPFRGRTSKMNEALLVVWDIQILNEEKDVVELQTSLRELEG